VHVSDVSAASVGCGQVTGPAFASVTAMLFIVTAPVFVTVNV
jgi:hypothetical protein